MKKKCFLRWNLIKQRLKTIIFFALQIVSLIIVILGLYRAKSIYYLRKNAQIYLSEICFEYIKAIIGGITATTIYFIRDSCASNPCGNAIRSECRRINGFKSECIDLCDSIECTDDESCTINIINKTKQLVCRKDNLICTQNPCQNGAKCNYADSSNAFKEIFKFIIKRSYFRSLF